MSYNPFIFIHKFSQGFVVDARLSHFASGYRLAKNVVAGNL